VSGLLYTEQNYNLDQIIRELDSHKNETPMFLNANSSSQLSRPTLQEVDSLKIENDDKSVDHSNFTAMTNQIKT
jgi:hypothetical protein